MFNILEIGINALERMSSGTIILGSIVSKDLNMSSKDVNFMFWQINFDDAV